VYCTPTLYTFASFSSLVLLRLVRQPKNSVESFLIRLFSFLLFLIKMHYDPRIDMDIVLFVTLFSVG
jgi:hypothetical protein